MSTLFKGISEKEKNKLFTLFKSHIYTFEANQNIIPVIKSDNIIGIIKSGSADVIRINYNGDKTLIEQLNIYDLFGSSLTLLNDNEIEIITKEKTTVLIINEQRLLNTDNINKKYYNIFMQNLFAIINEKIKNKNERIKILTNKTIRNRILEYFNLNQTNNRVILKTTFTNLANYLGVDRCAMTREFKYLKEEGFIEIKGKIIKILY